VTDPNFLEANKLFQRAEIQTYESEQQALRLNYQRLKAERVARQNSTD
jgi:hypothetical protein